MAGKSPNSSVVVNNPNFSIFDNVNPLFSSNDNTPDFSNFDKTFNCSIL